MPPSEVPPHSAPNHLPPSTAPKQLKRSGCKRLSRSISNNSSATWQKSICFKVRFRVVAPQVCRYPRDSQNSGSFFGRLFVTPFWTLFFSAQPLAHQNVKSHQHSVHHSLQAKRGYNLRMCAAGKRSPKITPGDLDQWQRCQR